MSTNLYAQATGAERPARPAAAKPRPLRPLSEEERERIAENYALIKKHLPEMVPLIKELHDAGLVDGLRAIQRVQVFDEKGA